MSQFIVVKRYLFESTQVINRVVKCFLILVSFVLVSAMEYNKIEGRTMLELANVASNVMQCNESMLFSSIFEPSSFLGDPTIKDSCDENEEGQEKYCARSEKNHARKEL